MNKIKILYVLVILCIAGNVFMAWQLHQNSKPPARKEPREIIIEKLHFNENQVKQYDELIRKHRSDIELNEKILRETKNALYVTLSQEEPLQTDTLMQRIQETQHQIELTHYHHFRDIRQLCAQEQLAAFDSLAFELAALFAPPHKPNHNLKH